MSNSDRSTRRFIRESLPLLASYLYSETVSLDSRQIEIGEDEPVEYRDFADSLRMRHAVACGLKLKTILDGIERGASTASVITRAESKGGIAGRLDVQQYLARRYRNQSWPKTFPVLITQETPNTPENQLVREILRRLGQRLSRLSLQEGSAERAYSLKLLRWSRERLHSDLWTRVNPNGAVPRLQREAEHRIRKRQTGNGIAYSIFLEWLKQWQFDASRSSPEEIDDLVSILLAFPPGDFFDDRVFEVWCLHQTIEAFRRAGAIITKGPTVLFARSSGPICELSYQGYGLEIWFQKALPSSAAGWRYVASRKLLAGIPDITVIGSDGRRLLIDAKRREVFSTTRPEETYKMLGYAENFRHLFTATPFWGILCFLSEQGLYTEIAGNSGQKIFLVGAHDSDPAICALAGRLDTAISEWLVQRPDLADMQPQNSSDRPM